MRAGAAQQSEGCNIPLAGSSCRLPAENAVLPACSVTSHQLCALTYTLSFHWSHERVHIMIVTCFVQSVCAEEL